jgi:uncharacterized protein (DUF736 family)
MIIGKFQQDNGGYTGSVHTLRGEPTAVRITPIALKGIDYIVTAGDETELGVGWNRVSKEKGTKYVSLKLDSPFMPAPAYGALVKQSDGSFALLWDRPDPKRGKKSDTAAAEPVAA